MLNIGTYHKHTSNANHFHKIAGTKIFINDIAFSFDSQWKETPPSNRDLAPLFTAEYSHKGASRC